MCVGGEGGSAHRARGGGGGGETHREHTLSRHGACFATINVYGKGGNVPRTSCHRVAVREWAHISS